MKFSRLPVLALGMFALLAAMWAGLLRLDWKFPELAPSLAQLHGPLMISGFFGTVINIERAVALNQRRYWLAPMLSGIGALVTISGLAPQLGIALLTLGSLGLVIIFGVIVRRYAGRDTLTMAIAALVWLVGNVMWFAEYPLWRVALWWMAFLVLTILGERLELARLMRLDTRAKNLYVVSAALLLAGLVLNLSAGWILPSDWVELSARVAGAGFLAIALWLLRYDIAQKTIKQTGLTRFIAVCLLVGYVWLGIGGALRVVFGVGSGWQGDALLHAVLLGYVFSMIFGHAPIIFPAILNRAIPYTPTFYLHLVLLHVSLVVRVIADLLDLREARMWAGMFNVIAILLFLFATVRAMRLGNPNRIGV
ncbi:MAG: hypothetical protein HY868_10335 [Chloroflexi bacterium]|nr:hypothetical protein [Chloroflexota bacterium]